tara:strand:- start:2710 stop:4665 length:1956 start_codon:yes stop_codon:yes gene_type:complete
MKILSKTIFFILFFSMSFSFNQNPVDYNITFEKDTLVAGSFIDINIDIDVEKGFYVYSADSLSLFPTRLEWTDSSYFSVFYPVIQPKPKTKTDLSTNTDIFYHEGYTQLEQRAKLNQNIKLGEHNLSGEFIYQVCNDKMCIPKWENFNKKVYIQSNLDSSIVEFNNLTTNEPNKHNRDQSIISKFMLAFFAGLIAILTPCVFPMIPMTVAFFAKSSNDNYRDSIKAGIIYGLSIIIIFTVIGVLFSAVFGVADLANELATSATANIIFAFIFLVFAISFFGYFEITIPNKLLNRINKKADAGGLLGIFFMALTLVLVSFSCTAPIVGTVMIDAVSGNIVQPIIVMLGFSIAFAIPFSLFAIFPGWLERLPKSGGWLNSVKIVLGFLELALCIKFLSMPDQAYHWGLLDRHVFLIIWISIFGAMGFYLLGFIKFKNDSKVMSFGYLRITFIIITFTFCGYMFSGLIGGNVSALSGIIPPPKYTYTSGNCKDIKPKYSNKLHIPHNIDGYFSYEQALDCAEQLDKPIFIDFTGHACFNCRRMEENVWIDEKVKTMLNDLYIVVALYVDDRTLLNQEEIYVSSFDGRLKKTLGKKNYDLQITEFGSNAQPFYVLLDYADKETLVEPKAYDTNIDNFIEFLELGINEFNKKRNLN